MVMTIIHEQQEIEKTHTYLRQKNDKLVKEIDELQLFVDTINPEGLLNELNNLINRDPNIFLPSNQTTKDIYIRQIEKIKSVISDCDPISYIRENLLKVKRILVMIQTLQKKYELEKNYIELIGRHQQLLDKIELLGKK